MEAPNSSSGSGRPRLRVMLAAIGTAVLGLAMAWYVFYPDRITSSRGVAYERTESSFSGVDLRITAFHEKTTGFALPGGIFVVESRRAGAPWVEIYETRQDDPVPIPFKVVALTEERLYLLGPREFIVTLDGGKSWKAWISWRDLEPGLKGAEYFYIRSVNLGGAGTGTMVLFSFLTDSPAVLRTEDGGQTWRPVP